MIHVYILFNGENGVLSASVELTWSEPICPLCFSLISIQMNSSDTRENTGDLRIIYCIPPLFIAYYLNYQHNRHYADYWQIYKWIWLYVVLFIKTKKKKEKKKEERKDERKKNQNKPLTLKVTL